MGFARLLLEAGADKNLANKTGRTALMIASASGHVETTRALLKAGADIDMTNNSGRTALMIASATRQSHTAKALLEAGADMDMRNNSGRTALMIASADGQLETVRVLLRAGANQNLTNNMGKTALTLAIEGGHDEISDLFTMLFTTLRVIQLSGEQVAAVPGEELRNVKALKQRLHQRHGMPPRFRQRLLLNGTEATLDDHAKLHASMVLQILRLPFRSASYADVVELNFAAARRDPAEAGST